MASLQYRLSRVEGALPPIEEKSWITELAPYLDHLELTRFQGIVERAVRRGNGHVVSELDGADLEALIEVAQQRRDCGWQIDRPDARVAQLRTKDRDKNLAIWQLIFALRARHPGCFFTELSDATYCDLLDVDSREILELAKLALCAQRDTELEPYADVILRMRLGGQRTSLEHFAQLVFQGLLPRAADAAA